MREDLLKGLTEEQVEKVKACKNNEELLKLAKEEGIELSDEQLAAVSGAGIFCASTPTIPCPKCGSYNVKAVQMSGALSCYWDCTCKNCGHEWNEY